MSYDCFELFIICKLTIYLYFTMSYELVFYVYVGSILYTTILFITNSYVVIIILKHTETHTAYSDIYCLLITSSSCFLEFCIDICISFMILRNYSNKYDRVKANWGDVLFGVHEILWILAYRDLHRYNILQSTWWRPGKTETTVVVELP
jgi:hypothetical protein